MLPGALGLCFGFGLGFNFGWGLLALYAGSAAGSWHLPALNLGLACAWGLASHEATALAWNWAWAWACLAGPGACAWALASAFAWASVLLCAFGAALNCSVCFELRFGL